jgi:DNA-binding MarR family transcriptional regulator
MATTGAKLDNQSLPLLDYLARVGRRAADASLSPGDLRPRHLIALKMLSERGAVSQQALGDLLGLDPSNVVSLLNDLEDRGLTTRRRDPADRRRHIVELSSAGEAELDTAYQSLGLIEDELLGALSTDERIALYELLVRAVGAASPPCDPIDKTAD